MSMENVATDSFRDLESTEFFNAIERDYRPYGLRQGPNEFFIVQGTRTIHIAKRYEVLVGAEGARRWVGIRDFIDQVLDEEGICIY